MARNRNRTPVRRLAAVATATGLALALGAMPASAEQDEPPAPSCVADPNATGTGFRLDHGRYRTINVPGTRLETSAYGIDDRGRIVGGYDTEDGTVHGFVAERGRYRRVDVPAAGTGPGRGTVLLKINARGHMLGLYDDQRDACHSFIRAHGRIRPIAVRGRPTQALGFNDHDVVVGTYVATDQVQRGFILDDGRVTTIEIPGAVTAGPSDINNHGRIAGAYSLPDGTIQAFLRDPDGDITTFDAPGDPRIVLPLGINDRDEAVGLYVDDDGRTHGFKRSARGRFTTIDAPGAGDLSQAHEINDRGQIVGFAGTSLPTADTPAVAGPMSMADPTTDSRTTDQSTR
jgi:uncharacterized membrane protein